MATRLPDDSSAVRSGPPTVRLGITSVTLTKSLDALTTVVGLTVMHPSWEANPLARTVFNEIGVVPGLILGSIATILTVTAITELGVVVAARFDGHRSDAVLRFVGYGLASGISVVIAIHNGLVLVGPI